MLFSGPSLSDIGPIYRIDSPDLSEGALLIGTTVRIRPEELC